MSLVRRVLATREGTIAFAIVAAVLAAVMLMAFTRGYKRSVERNGESVTVLVAKDALPKGSSGDVIAEKGLFQTTGFARDQVKDGAITDPATLRGLVAAHPLVRGQQITIADFVKPSDPVLSRLADERRAMTIPLDSAHGMIGRIHAGDHVDVLTGFQVQPDGAGRPRPVLRTLLQDVEVLEAPAGDKGQGGLGSSSSQTQNVTLRIAEKDAPQLAFASDNGKVWIVLRAQAGAKQSAMSLVTLDRLLLGLDPIPVDRFLANKRSLIRKVYRGDF
jgi:Flp pilus assembly protein CpaB